MNAWKSKAIRQMKSGRIATLELFSKLTPRQISAPHTQGEWSIKDVLAHFVAWEEVAVSRLMWIRAGKPEKVHYFEDINESNRFNARAVRRLSALSWKQLLARAKEIRGKLEAEILNLPEAELNNPAHRYPVKKWLPEFAWTHEAGHRRRISKAQTQNSK